MDVINQDRVTDPARLQRLRELMVLDAEPDPALDRLTSLASRVLKMPISLVSLVDAHRQFFASGVGLEDPWASARQTPLEYSYCKHVVATNEPLIISDARTEPLTADSPSIVELNAIAYAGFPLMLSDGTNLGSFCVLDNKPHTWTPEELAILSDLAQSAITELELRSELLQRQRAEKALEEARRFTEETLRAVPDFVFVYRLATRQIVYANRSAASVLGYSAEQMRAMVAGPVNSGDIFAALVHPDDVATLLNEREALLSAPSDNLRETEFRLKHADGTWHWFQARGKIFERHPETGMPDTVLGTAADVTERRRIQDERNQTESRLRSLVRVENEFAKSLEIDDILLMTMDMALRFTGASDGYIAMMENDDILHLVTRAGVYEKDTRFFAEEGIVGRAVRTRSPQLVPDVRRDPEYVQNVDRTVAQMVVPMRRRKGVLGVINLETSRPDERFSAEVLGSVKSLADRAALALENALLLKEKEAQLQELSEIHSRLMKLEQLKTDMIRIAAHDLRNPLGSIIGFGQLMMEEKERLEPDHVDFLEMINRSASKMQKIIEDILSLERIEEMQKGTFTNRIDLTEIIRSSVADMGIRALSKHQHLTLDMGDMPVLVSGDEPQIREAADNLIGNAIKYTPEQGQIVVSLRTINDRAVFEVEDNGIGIPEAQQSKLFSPFFRAKTEETQDIEGTGLGLHLVKNIIERHHGRMRFSSTYGKGSMFGFEMPIAR